MKRIFSLLGLLFILLLLLTSGYFLFAEREFLLRSKAQTSLVSAPNTYCFTTPSCATAGGEEIARVTCFCLDNRGLGVSGIDTRILATEPNQYLSVNPLQSVTDEFGKAIYDMRSTQAGTFDISVYCASTFITENHKVCFK